MFLRLLPTTLLLIATLASAGDRFCANESFEIDARFDGGAFAKCKFKDEGVVELTIKPEDHKVTIEQPWFAFKVTGDGDPAALTVRLRFPDAYARYWPKLSNDGQTWTRADENRVSVSKNQREMELQLDAASGTTWVAAQELLTQSWYDNWLAELESHPELITAIIGMTPEGRPIRLTKSRMNRRNVVVLLGRQHPAEVPGALAMREFVDVVLGDTELARDFRRQFTLLIIPLVNPDGVANGHWRHNSGRTDLNRDWGPFTQPETLAIAKLLAGVDKLGLRPRLMLDFHATKFTDSMLFYTQTKEDVTDPDDFAIHWFAAVRERAPEYEFKHDPRPLSEQPNTKGYFFTRYGIPSFTYEVGDEADREALRAVTPIFAEEMMRTLLASD